MAGAPVSDEGWEQRMSERAKARRAEALEHETQLARYERRNPDLPWLNGYPRDDLRHVWVINARRCIGCGRGLGAATIALTGDEEFPPMPAWPFTPDACPVCLGSEPWATLRVDLGEPGSTNYPRTELRELRDE